MRVIAAPAHTGATVSTRVLLLPGAYQTADDFVHAGFATAVAARALALDLYFIDLQPQHLTDREPLRQLHQQLVQPARAAGIHVWILGISFGGLLGLLYAQQYPHMLRGLCLLAPYLGNRALCAEIQRAGGLARWDATHSAGPDAEERTTWRFIHRRQADGLVRFMGYGRDDRFAAAHRLLAAALPSATADVIPGGHDWRTWRQLWDNFLDQEHMLSS